MGHPTYSLVSIRKNVFWLKQNFICSDRILTFGIRSRFNLRRDGDRCGLPECMWFRSHGGLWLKAQARGPPASLPCRPGIKMLGAEEEKESNVTLRKERESYSNVITYFHEIIRVHMSEETYTYHRKRQPQRDVGGWMEKRQRIELSKVSPESFQSAMSRRAGQG